MELLTWAVLHEKYKTWKSGTAWTFCSVVDDDDYDGGDDYDADNILFCRMGVYRK